MSMTSDLALAADPGFLDRAEDPAGFILQACKQAIEWFAQAPGYEGIDEIVRVRADAAVALAYARQAKLGLDTALIVAEASRRADRALGLAIRAGQQAGAVYGYKRGRVSPQRGDGTLVRFVREFAPASDLAPGGGQPGIYDFTDGVTSEQFEQAITASRDEGNLSRKNLARKIADAAAGRDTANWVPRPGDRTAGAAARRREIIRDQAGQGYSSRQIGAALGIDNKHVRRLAGNASISIPADASVSRTRAFDSPRIVEETVLSLEALVMGLAHADPADLAPADAKDWAASLTDSIRSLNQFKKRLKETIPSD